MTKFVLLMIMCSGIPGNDCKPIPTPINEFDKYHKCIIYGYDYSSELLKTFDTKSVDQKFLKFLTQIFDEILAIFEVQSSST